jgi:hypothetical protein
MLVSITPGGHKILPYDVVEVEQVAIYGATSFQLAMFQ